MTSNAIISTADSTKQPKSPHASNYINLNNPDVPPKDPKFDGNPKEYPVLVLGKYTYWALSYEDNREAFDILVYDQNLKLAKSLEVRGARYLWKIELDGDTVVFIGQSERRAPVKLAELEVRPKVTTGDSTRQPKAPHNSHYINLNNPDVPPTDPSFNGDPKLYPVLEIGEYTAWALSYNDNRSAFNILIYDADNKLVKDFEAKGARYLWKIVLEGDVVQFIGQAREVAYVNLTEFQLY